MSKVIYIYEAKNGFIVSNFAPNVTATELPMVFESYESLSRYLRDVLGAGAKNELARSIDDLRLSTRTTNNLKAEGVMEISQLVALKEIDVLRLCNISKKSLMEIRSALADHGLSLGMVATNRDGEK